MPLPVVFVVSDMLQVSENAEPLYSTIRSVSKEPRPGPSHACDDPEDSPEHPPTPPPLRKIPSEEIFNSMNRAEQSVLSNLVCCQASCL